MTSLVNLTNPLTHHPPEFQIYGPFLEPRILAQSLPFTAIGVRPRNSPAPTMVHRDRVLVRVCDIRYHIQPWSYPASAPLFLADTTATRRRAPLPPSATSLVCMGPVGS